MTIHVICFGNAQMIKDCKLNIEAGTFWRNAQYVSNLNAVGANDTIIVYTHGGYNLRKEDDSSTAYSTNVAEISLGTEVGLDGKRVERKKCLKAGELLEYMREKKLPQKVEGLKVILHVCHSAGTIEEGRTEPPEADKSAIPEHKRRPSATFAYGVCEAMKDDYADVCVFGYQGTMGAGFAGMPAEGTEHLEGRRKQPAMHDCRMEYTVHKNASSESIVILREHGDNIVWKAPA